MNAINSVSEFLPGSIEAEQSLLGAVLMNNDAYLAVSEIVEPHQFSEQVHERLWEMVGERIMRGERVTPVTMSAALGPDATLEIGSGMTVKVYLARLCSEATTIINVPDFARTIRDLWARRRLIDFARELQARAVGGFDTDTVEALMEQADSELGAIRFGKSIQGISWIGEAADKALHLTAEAHQGSGKELYQTSIQTIDRVIGPMMAGDFVTVLGASGHGKTALGVQALRAAARPNEERPKGARGILISQEMGMVPIVRRQMAADTGISTRDQRSGGINQAEYERLHDSAKGLHGLPIMIDESGRQKVSSIIKKLRALKKLHDVKFCVIDHSRLIRPEHPKQSEIETISNAAMELKDAAKTLDMVIMMLAQPTREGLKTPMRWRLTDDAIYGGDVLRQASDIVMSIALPYTWLSKREPDPSNDYEHSKWSLECKKWFGLAEFAALKLRDGEPTGWQTLGFNGAQTKFVDR